MCVPFSGVCKKTHNTLIVWRQRIYREFCFMLILWSCHSSLHLLQMHPILSDIQIYSFFFLNSHRLIVPVVLFILTESEIGSTLPIGFGLRFFFVYCIIWSQWKEKKNVEIKNQILLHKNSWHAMWTFHCFLFL